MPSVDFRTREMDSLEQLFLDPPDQVFVERRADVAMLATQGRPPGFAGVAVAV